MHGTVLTETIKVVLFDAVGTLIYPDPPVVEAYAAAGRSCGSEMTAEQIASAFRAAFAKHNSAGGPTSELHERERWRRIVAETLFDVPDRHFNALFERLWEHFGQAHHWRLYSDVEPVIAELHGRGFELGIASNFDRRLLTVAAGHAALRPCTHVFVSSEIGHCKPSLEFFRAVEQRLGIAPEQIALIGDDEINDVQGATAAGWLAVKLDRGGQRPGGNFLVTLRELC